MISEPEHPFAPFVRTLGRGPGRSRALTREEARDALAAVLRGEAEPEQVGAFLMLLRYRGEAADEIAGLVEAARAELGAGLPPGCKAVDLDWPSYGAGRTRGEPWFLLAALALAACGTTVLLHGSNEFSQGTAVEVGLAAMGLPVCRTREQAGRELARHCFAYLPLETLSPALDRLLTLRGLLGLRSPINTVVRLLNPFDAPASVDGVFHPPYIEVHLGAAERLGRRRLAVVKGGGGEAERNPAKPANVHLWDRDTGRSEVLLSARPAAGTPGSLLEAWRTGAGPGAAVARATIALALLALGRAEAADAADAQADASGPHGCAPPGRRTDALMRYLPIFLDVRGRRALVLGAGEVGERKAEALRRAGAEVVFAEAFAPELLDGCVLAIGADAPEAELERLSVAARARALPVNVVDRPALCSFITPAVVDREPLIVAIGSAGEAPVLARLVRARIEAMLPPALSRLAAIAGSLSAELRARFPKPSARRRVLERMLAGRAADLVLAGDEAAGIAEMRREIEGGSAAPPGIVHLVPAGPGAGRSGDAARAPIAGRGRRDRVGRIGRAARCWTSPAAMRTASCRRATRLR